MQRTLIVGLDETESDEIRQDAPGLVLAHSTLPRIRLDNDGTLYAERTQGPGFLPIDKVVFHALFEDDLDFITALALWGGPCLPHAHAMMDCRLKLPCLVRALRHTRFAAPRRGYLSPHTPLAADTEKVAKWGNWHCGEDKARVQGNWTSDNPCLIEPFLPGTSVRVMCIGDTAWQIQLGGDDWLKSVHDPAARFMDLDPALLADTQTVARGLGLDILANDYIVQSDGTPHLLEVNHIPTVTRFPEIWQAYRHFTVQWIAEGC